MFVRSDNFNNVAEHDGKIIKILRRCPFEGWPDRAHGMYSNLSIHLFITASKTGPSMLLDLYIFRFSSVAAISQIIWTGLNIKIGIVQKVYVRVTKLVFCQNDSPIGGSFLQKDSLFTHMYTFWTMPILISSPVQMIMGHPLSILNYILLGVLVIRPFLVLGPMLTTLLVERHALVMEMLCWGFCLVTKLWSQWDKVSNLPAPAHKFWISMKKGLRL
mgnify:CR=1 FL=1